MLAKPAFATSRRSMLLAGAGALLAGNRGRADDIRPLGCSPCDDTIGCFEPYDFPDSKGQAHRIYVAGDGPPVLVLHELPGLTPADIVFAKRLIGEGYTVLLPLLFGEPGENRTVHYLFNECARSKFDCNASDRTPDAVKWIKEFCRCVPQKWHSERGMGVVGMCLTGAYPLALLDVDSVAAPVLCQPTAPFNLLNYLKLRKSAKIGIASTDLDFARDHSSVPILGIRYAGDGLCPGGRFNALTDRFKGRFFRMDLDGGHKHSSLGSDFACVAYEEVRAFLRWRLIDPNEKFPVRSVANATDPAAIKDEGCGIQLACAGHAH